MRVEPAVLAVLGTVFGGVGLKIIEHWLGKKKAKTDLASELRDELREDMKDLRQQLKEERERSELWEERYWELKTGQLLINEKVRTIGEVSEAVHPDAGLRERLQELPD
ncbi:hypothetical protein FHN55_16985 [Streptomyces sp. NP160]|uniref:hypothetical protein n=1 Tax=Streptomyces sp. NP160 TaxID=2586637 RepID=UPI0011187F0B|nr:hypothetical protein [Streptomyces sp. NP160]TNM61525.1 hypothetical protein FHN55_16985 [Streptomyces sp. NP160]